MLENERLRLGELRKKHYEIAGVPLEQLEQVEDALSSTFPSSPKPSKPSLMKKPALAQKPNIPTKNMVRLLLTFFSDYSFISHEMGCIEYKFLITN